MAGARDLAARWRCGRRRGPTRRLRGRSLPRGSRRRRGLDLPPGQNRVGSTPPKSRRCTRKTSEPRRPRTADQPGPARSRHVAAAYKGSLSGLGRAGQSRSCSRKRGLRTRRWPGPRLGRDPTLGSGNDVLFGCLGDPPERMLGLALELPDTLPGDAKFVGELGQGRRFVVAEAVALDQDVPLAFRQPLERPTQAARLEIPYNLPDGVRGPLVLEELADLGAVGVGTHRLVEASGIPQRALYIANLVHRPTESIGYLLVGGLTLELGRELVLDAGHLANLVSPVDRYPDGASLVCHGALYRLPDPPGGVGGEPEALVGVELLHRPHKPYVALLDEVLEGQPLPAVLFGDADHEPEVLLDEPLPCPSVAGFGPPRQVHLLAVRQKGPLVDTRKVARQNLRRLRSPLRRQRRISLVCHLVIPSILLYRTVVIYTIYYIIVKSIERYFERQEEGLERWAGEATTSIAPWRGPWTWSGSGGRCSWFASF